MLNVGAGTGSYEPSDRDMLALDPSAVMIGQRPPGAAPAIQASAEEIPLADGSVDAAMAVLSDHHWSDRAAGLRELARVARRRIVVFSFDPSEWDRLWLNTEYLTSAREIVPEPYRVRGVWEAELRELLPGEVRVEPVPIPHDCADGFYGSFWRRPAAYLDPLVRSCISVFSRLPAEELESALAALRRDLESGNWDARHPELLRLDELELGYRLVVAELG
ncbi:MAG: class I SAM-dependent methyltransferase [Thermoleophilaceae bacterium]